MPQTLSVTSASNGFTLKAYRGDGAALLAFNLEQHYVEHLAGFAIQRVAPGGHAEYLVNRLSFESAYTSKTIAKDRKWRPSNLAPFQKFWWVDFPPMSTPGLYNYRVTVMRFQGSELKEDQSAEVSLELGPFRSGKLEMGFTRGYLFSQAYSTKFGNAPIRPLPKTLDYDTTNYRAQYEWLGYHARKMIFDLLDECLNDREVTVDVFAYDLDEPDIVKKLSALGPRLRLLLDDAPLHNGGALEPEAFKKIRAAGAQAKRGKFGRFAHDKIIIKKKNGQAVKVLTGSTNFSVTGLCVNANNALIFDQPDAAALYERVFDLAFQTQAKLSDFTKADLSKKEFDLTQPGLPEMFVSFAPHKHPTFSLNRAKKALDKANSSVLFAVMGLKGSGPVLTRLKKIHADPRIFSYGVTDELGERGAGGVTVYKPDKAGGVVVSARALTQNVPEPFVKEATAGGAHRVHHKFVVLDFNDVNPVLFTGSSNLAAGGEEKNGDNLIAIYDREIVSAFAIEAIRLVDHYHFRAAMKQANKAKPLRLKRDAEQWWKNYYDPKSMKYKERLLFAR